MIEIGKRNVLGVLVDAVDLETAVSRITRAAATRTPYRVTALAVHGVMTGVFDGRQRRRLNEFDLVVPDGQPVRWALNILYRAGLESPVRGTDLALAVLAASQREALPVFLYGSTPETLAGVQESLRRRFADLEVAGALPSRFSGAGRVEQEQIADAIRSSGARVVFVGLGCPRQETFVSVMAPRVGCPMLAVGAAFDYLAGRLREPPPQLRRYGLEWAWRLILEPKRLWRRYLLLNPTYLALLALQAAHIFNPPVLTGAQGEPAELDA